MGGGDLNLKKSWHPQTLKNQEKVWKAEQAKSQEEKKLNDLRREIEEERNRDELKRIGRESGVLGGNNEDNKKLDWMYKSSTELINREEYLLGRKVDKSFEVLQDEEKQRDQQNLVGVKQPLNHVEHECVPFSIRAYKNLQSSEQVDLQRKVMEDPLMLIKQREMESRRKILENPVKLKELHRILKTDEKLRKVSKKSKKSKKVKKSKKKQKKRSRSTSKSSSASDSDIDTKLAKKLKGGLLSKDDVSNMGLNLTKLLDSKFEKISLELDKAAGKNKSKRKKTKKHRSDADTDNSDVSDRSKDFNKHCRPRSKSREKTITSNKYDKRRPTSTEKRKEKGSEYRHFRPQSRDRGNSFRNRSKSRSDDKYGNRRNRSLKRSRTRSRERYERRRNHPISPSRDGNTDKPRSRSRPRFHKRSKSQSPSRIEKHLSHSPDSSTTTNRSKKLSEEEKQAKIREMMLNAAWREEERTEVVRKHREAYAREEETHKASEFDKDFLNKEVKKAIENQTSVGSRLRANLNNIQRTSAAMNSNFARK